MTVGSRAQVYHGAANHTAGGLTRSELTMGKDGEIKSIKAMKAAKKNPGLKKWRKAVDTAKKSMGIPKKGEFALLKGKLLKETRKAYAKKK